MMSVSTKEMKRLLQVGFGEGISFIILLGIAMPLKYMYAMPLPVRVVGMLHGVLFIWYVIALLQARRANGISNSTLCRSFHRSLRHCQPTDNPYSPDPPKQYGYPRV